MKGFRSLAVFRGYTVGEAEMHFTPGGKAVTVFTIGVGGNRDKGIRGLMVRCQAWEENAEEVSKMVGDKGLAVEVVGRVSQKAVQKNGKIYVNTDLNIDRLAVQVRKDDKELTVVNIIRKGKDGKPVESEGKAISFS